MKRKKQNETYVITMKGLMLSCPGIDEFQVNWIYDALELFGHRHEFNAILLKDGGILVNVELSKEK